MPQISSSLLSLFLVLFLHYTLVSCIESEARALLAWRSSLKYPGNLTMMWSDHISSDPCHWEGIQCNDAGSITNISYVGGEGFYRHPDVYYEPIVGTLAKFNLSLLPNLLELSFENNYFQGGIPKEIENLHHLDTLFLMNNNLTGQFPKAILNLSNLEYLDLSHNEFSGPIPIEIIKLFNLCELYLSHNNFTGEIPTTLGSMIRLRSLDLSFNELQGGLPNTIAQLSYLDVLQLSDNRLSGSITPYFGTNNSNLYYIDLSNNNFMGTIPSLICRGGDLWYLYASNNNFDDLLPSTLQNCTGLSFLDLRNNNIKADISHIFGNLPSLRLSYVDLSQNRLYGRLPRSLEGKLPSAFVSMKALQVINLDSNNLMGEIPSELINLPDLSILILSNNEFSSLPMINANRLSSIHLNNNKLGGEFPLLAGNWTSLVTLDLGENNFSGEIPSGIGFSFPTLKILCLRSNQFNGTIPLLLSKLNHLQLLDLSNNNLIGPIPHVFFAMSSMAVKASTMRSYIDLLFYNEKIVVVWKGEEVSFQSTIDLLMGVDLSCNSLSGNIPEDLVKLQGLDFLNLSRNHLSGVIPYYIGNLTWLEVLDLSMNHFSGTIPSSISHLTHLDVLNLSHNKLTGQIPIGSQIQTLNPSAFSDNDGLCGTPLPNSCSTHDISIVPLLNNNNGEYHKLEVIWITCSTISGFIIGFWVYFGTLFWRPSLRFAIFHFTDELQDKIMI